VEENITKLRSQIAEIGALMYERHLTDSAGGNISARAGDLICITPRYSGSKYRWQLCPEQVLVVDSDGKKLDGEGEISREARVHLKLLAEFPMAGAVVHGHAQNALVFCCAARPIPAILEDTLKFGQIEVTEFAPAHSPKLADNIYKLMLGQEERIRKQAAAILAPWHGVFVLGKDLDAAYDTIERVDTNARCALLLTLIAEKSASSALVVNEALTRAMLAF
jgi:L-fuculose-phosphate aldolase